MNALMVIDVRVRSAAALAQLRGLEAASNKSAMGMGRVNKQASFGLPWLSKWGNQVQWAGRQLMYNFTLPLGIAAVAGTKWALANEAAMVRVQKVYGDGSKVFQKLYKTEIPALSKAFEALSNQFGQSRADVINIAADWAAAGASGIALAKSVKLTLETMVLGELDAATATKQLIAIQAQYGQSVGQLSHTIDILNMVENQTGATMADLMNGMSRAAGVARVTGVDVEHLGAMMAALVPSTGSAANAGNALKTIMSRLLAPTADAADLLGRIGISVKDAGWQSLNAADRIELLAKRYDGLSSAAKANIASVVGSRYQFNRLVILLTDVTNANGYYQKSLRSTSDQQKIFAQRQKELNQVLTSNPQKLKQAWVILQNALANVVMPLLPFLVYLTQEIGKLASAFQDLSVGTQKWVLVGLVFLALVGPLARYIGALTNLFGLLAGALHGLTAAFVGTFKYLGIFTFWIFKLATAPFRLIWAGLIGIGEASLVMGGAFLKGVSFFVGKPVIGILTAGLVRLRMVLIGGLLVMAGPMRAAGQLIGEAFVLGWAATVTTLQVIWSAMLVSMQGFYAAMRAATVATVVGIRATWVTLTTLPMLMAAILGGVSKVFLAFRIAVLTIWVSIWVGMAKLAPIILRALTGPIGLAITAVFLLLVAFQKQIGEAFHNVVGAFGNIGQAIGNKFKGVGEFFNKLSEGIIKAFWALPTGVRDALLAVLNVVVSAAKQIYEWMSYLNPFARHSPSLVDQVTKGNGIIRDQYARTAASVKKHQAAIRQTGIDNQQKVVDRWKFALDRANNALDIQERKLSVLKDRLDAVQSLYDAHADSLQNYAQAPLKGMRAMGDQIFANEQAQKKLRLEMLQWEAVNGSLDDTQNKLANIAGSIEQLNGEAGALRLAGAGSDVLGPINAQIDAMNQQATALRSTVQNSPIADLQKQMDDLARQGEILDLQNSLNFDPLVRQIDQLANGQKELSFDQVIAGITKEQHAMAALQPKIDLLTKAVAAQDAVVQKSKDTRDQISDRYDVERQKLALLKKSYDDLTGSIHGANAAGLGKASGAAALAKGKGLGYAASSFEASKAGDFPDVGGKHKIGREGGMGDQSALIDKFTQGSLDDMAKIIGNFDMLAPLKKKWNVAWAWIKQNIGPVVTDVGIGIHDAFANLGDVFSSQSFQNKANTTFTNIYNVFQKVWAKIKGLIDLFAPDFKRAFDAIVEAGQKLWKQVGPNLLGLFHDLGPVLKVVAALIVLLAKLLTEIASRVLGPILNMIIDILDGAISVIRGFVNIIVGIFTLDLGKIWEGVRQIFGGLVEIIVGLVKGLWLTLVGLVKGIVMGVVHWFQWLFDQIVGHSIIPDLIRGILFWFGLLVKLPMWIWNHVLSPVVDKIKSFWTDNVKPFLVSMFGKWKDAWNNLLGIAKWVWDNVLSPAFTKIKSFWTDNVKPFLGTIFGLWKSQWQNLTGLGQWVYNNVMQPVIDKIKAGWNAIKDWLKDNKDILLGPVKGIVNTVIKGVNKLIDGLNLVSKALPGISFHIGQIELLASGGKIPTSRVGSGFMTNGARAIVGEGKPNHPEYVIPTDPTHRSRAVSLLASAAQKMNMGLSIDPTRHGIMGDTSRDMQRVMATNPQAGAGAIPMFGIGGIIPGPIKDIASNVKNLGAWAKGNLQELASTAAKPAFKIAKALIKTVDWAPARGLGNAGIEVAEDWVKGVDKAFSDRVDQLNLMFGGANGVAWKGDFSPDVRIARAQKWAASQVGHPYLWNGVGPGGYDCSGFMAAVTNVIRGQDPHHRLGNTASFPWLGFSGGADPNGFTIGSTTNYGGSGVGHMAGTLAGMNVESHAGAGVVIGKAARGYGDGGFSTRAHLAGLREGAIIRARMGGTIFRGGEGSNDEAIVPLPKDWRSSIQHSSSSDSNKTIIHIHGNLEFPNIQSGDDADSFIKNLEILARN